MTTPSEIDRSYMAAAIRYARRHLARTGSNPAVSCLLVNNGVIVGRGITAKGGRPHAEAVAIKEAGALAEGATAYVTLEPCAHHGKTPPCANALVTAKVARVVVAASDPDDRVSGRGNAVLREAGLTVLEDVLRKEAAIDLAGYLSRTERKRPIVTLKLAISADGMLGLEGSGQVKITGTEARAQTDILRAHHEAIAIGIGTMMEDDPGLTCRLNGGMAYSPARFVLDRHAKTPLTAKMLRDKSAATTIVVSESAPRSAQQALQEQGAHIMAADSHDGKIALHEFLYDLSAKGIASLMVEGGAKLAQSFLEEGLVDKIALFVSDIEIGAGGVKSPIDINNYPEGFEVTRRAIYGKDSFVELTRI